MSDVSALPPAIRAYVRGFVLRGRRLSLWRGLGLTLSVLFAWFLAACVADRFLQLPSGIRLASLCGAAAIPLLLLARPLMQFIRPDTDWVRVAERIERQNPRFGQRLVTIISRLVGRPEHRGSDEILEHLVYELDRQVADERADALVPLHPVVRAWILVGLLLALGIGLSCIRDLGMPRLALRFIAPLANVPPVTTTQLRVTPGNRDVTQSMPLQVDVDTDRLPDGQVWLVTSQDEGRNWSRTSMNASGDGRFTFTLTSIDRDLLYYVTGGDASSPKYQVRVLRKPAIASFQIRYIYPAYTGKPAQVVTNADGRIEAPAGTDAVLTITSTEPLQSALLTIGGEKTLMSRTGADNQRQARITVLKDERYELDLISTRDQTGTGPATTTVHALADRPPMVRVLQPATDSLRLNPRDILSIAYEAADDYGLESLAIRSQVGAAAPSDSIIETFATARPEGPAAPSDAAGDAGATSAGNRADADAPRHRQGVCAFDLATLPLNIGDVVTLVIIARDTGGSPAYSEPIHVLVSPRSVDLDAHIRISELGAADQLCGTVVEELEAAAKAFADAQSKGADSQAGALPLGRMNRWLAATSEAAALVRRSLVRADARSNAPELSTALAAWVDAAQTISSTADELFRSGAETSGARQSAGESIQRLLQSARELQSALHTVSQGERARALLLDRDNLAASEKRPAPKDAKAAEIRSRTLQRTREDIADGAKQIGLKPDAGDLANQLKSKADAAKPIVRDQHPIDFGSIAKAWSQRMQQDASRHGSLDDRLGAAAQAEAVRPDADAVWARDLQLAGRAASAVQSAARGAAPSGAGGKAPVANAAVVNEFAAAVEALQREHTLRHPIDGPRRPDELAVAHANAVKAREQLAGIAGENDAIASAGGPARASQTTAPAGVARGTGMRHGRAEGLALRAAAAASSRNYVKAAELDRALARQVTPAQPATSSSASPDATTAMNTAAPQQQAADVERGAQALRRTMASVERIDGLGTDQQKLVEQTRSARTSPAAGANAAADALAARQQGVAEQISAAGGEPGASDESNWRERASASIVASQQRLAALPEQLAQMLQAAAARRDAVKRADAARRDADGAPQDRKPAAERAARQAADDAASAAERLDAAAKAVAPSVAETMSSALEPLAPEASAARDAVNLQLAPALKKLADAARTSDAGATDRAAADVRLAVEAAQKDLASAQESFTDRDPLIAAKWFARAAVDALHRRPPDLDTAERRQRQTSAALDRAWSLALHRAADQRLALVPSMRPMVALAAPADALAPDAARGAGPIARDWRRLRERATDDVAATAQRDGEPSEYESALKAYFEALNRARDGNK